MEIVLDGNDWEVDYFITNEEYLGWKQNGRHIHRMLMDNAGSSGFITPGAGYAGAMRGTVPGCERTVLRENGKIDDPYVGRNLDTTRWVEDFCWGFRKRFRVPPDWKECRQVMLTFAGIDYEADFFLNGCHLGFHRGMFTAAKFDITGKVDFNADNLLAVIFRPMPKASPNHRSDTPAAFAEYHRMQMSYGWDWSRSCAAAGIWDSVRIHGYGAVKLNDLFVHYTGEHIDIELELTAFEKTVAPLELSLRPMNFKGTCFEYTESAELAHGANRLKFSYPADRLERWQPNGCGKQNLYELTIQIGGLSYRRRIGFKTVRMTRNPDSPEGANDLTFEINGKALFVKGLNYVPADLMISQAKPEHYERLVRLAAEAGFNLFRIWGGGIVEKEIFYDCCDRYGILVWQEFMHACSSYRKDPEYLAFKRGEGEEIVRKLRNHVSLALFCGGNELLYYGEFADSPLLLQYGEIVRAFAPHLPYHVSSPDKSRPGERDHGPWSFREHEFYNHHFRQLCSEIGCGSFPEQESVSRFIPADEPFPSGQSWNYHFLYRSGGHDVHWPLAFFKAETLEEHCQTLMYAQADACGYVMEHYRRNFPRSSGCILWQYNEPWPTFAFSIVDYYGLPKMAYYRLRQANQPLCLSLCDRSFCCQDGMFEADLYIINDHDTPKLELEAVGMDLDGQVRFHEQAAGHYATGSTFVKSLRCALPTPLNGGLFTVFLKIRDRNKTLFRGERCYGVPDYGALFKLPPVELDCTVKVKAVGMREYAAEVSLCNEGSHVAPGIRFSFADIPHERVYWHDNYIVLAPGETRRVTARISGEMPSVLVCRGWNCRTMEIAVSPEIKGGNIKNIDFLPIHNYS